MKIQVHYERMGVYTLEEVLPFAVPQSVVQDLFSKGIKRRFPEFKSATERDYNGHMVKMDSLRYCLFAEKGVACVHCGIKGEFFSLERVKSRTNNPQRYHFNLYAYGPEGSWQLITKDHIIPVSRGGKDVLPNLQVMCSKCNRLKSNNSRIKQVFIVMKSGKVEGCYSDDNLEVIIASESGFETHSPEIGRQALNAAARVAGLFYQREIPDKLLDTEDNK